MDGERSFWGLLLSVVRQDFMGGDAPKPGGGSGERRGSQDDKGSDELGRSRDLARPSITGFGVGTSPPVHRPPVRPRPRPPDETEIPRGDILPPAPGAQGSQIPETYAPQSLQPFQNPEIPQPYGYNATQQQASPFTIVPPETPFYHGAVDFSAYVPWGNPHPPTSLGSVFPVHGSSISVGVSGNIATAPASDPHRKSGIEKLSRTLKSTIRRKRKRVGRGGRRMCARCRRMRNPEKYLCTPLDHSNPTGGCVECHQAGILCDRRETPAEERERLKTSLMPMGSIAPWHPQVYRNDDVRAIQADLIAVAQSDQNNPSGFHGSSLRDSYLNEGMQRHPVPPPPPPARAAPMSPLPQDSAPEVDERPNFGDALRAASTYPSEESPFFDPSLLWDLVDSGVLPPDFFTNRFLWGEDPQGEQQNEPEEES